MVMVTYLRVPSDLNDRSCVQRWCSLLPKKSLGQTLRHSLRLVDTHDDVLEESVSKLPKTHDDVVEDSVLK